MDKNFSAKQSLKKVLMAAEKAKKSGSRKKKKIRKPLSATKRDRSPDTLEIEGVRALDQAGAESDSSCGRQQGTSSPPASVLSSTALHADTVLSPINEHNPIVNDALPAKPVKPKSAKSFSQKTVSDSEYNKPIKPVLSTSVLASKDPYYERVNGSTSKTTFEDTISTTLSNMTVKQKNSIKSGRSKTGSSKSSVGAKSAASKARVEADKAAKLKAEAAAKLKSEESLRWEKTLLDEEMEEERIRIYKINRRKRYLAAAQQKGLGWVVNYGTNGSPVLSEDSGVDLQDREPRTTVVSEYNTVLHTIMPSQSGTPLSYGSDLAVVASV